MIDGPFDSAEAPDDDLERIDLGALLVPAIPETEMRLEATENGAITGVMVVDGRSGVQLVAVAAPRTEGIWDEVRASLRANLLKDGANVVEENGAFGPELCVVMGSAKDQYARFVGIDGPRWMLRSVFRGAAGKSRDEAGLLMEVVQNTIVVRGDDPRPVRDQLPLHIPEGMAVPDEVKQQ